MTTEHCTCRYGREPDGTETRTRDPECPVHGRQRKPETR